MNNRMGDSGTNAINTASEIGNSIICANVHINQVLFVQMRTPTTKGTNACPKAMAHETYRPPSKKKPDFANAVSNICIQIPLGRLP